MIIQRLILSIGIAAVMLMILALIISLWIPIEDPSQNPTYIHCCGGNMCSDTYYDAKTNICHLVLCERDFWNSNNKCTYPGEK